jgi:hypothetical protein
MKIVIVIGAIVSFAALMGVLVWNVVDESRRAKTQGGPQWKKGKWV